MHEHRFNEWVLLSELALAMCGLSCQPMLLWS